MTDPKPYTPKEMQDLVEWLEKNQIVPVTYGDRLMATAAAAEQRDAMETRADAAEADWQAAESRAEGWRSASGRSGAFVRSVGQLLDDDSLEDHQIRSRLRTLIGKFADSVAEGV